GANEAGFAARQPPQRDYCRDHEAVHLHVERIERPAAKAGAHRAAFLGVQFAEPSQHRVSPLSLIAGDPRVANGMMATDFYSGFLCPRSRGSAQSIGSANFDIEAGSVLDRLEFAVARLSCRYLASGIL